MRPHVLSVILALALGDALPAHAADLPSHAPLRILIVSDGVNPHGLPAASLTEPGEVSAALLLPGSGLNLDPAMDGVVEIPTNDIHLATAALMVPQTDPAAYDVLVYFAHRAPDDDTAMQNAADQAAFVAAVDGFLVDGGGVVCFHHGIYPGAGKTDMNELLGGHATNVDWDTVDGQNVINVAPGHFVTSHEVEYTGTVTYDDATLGIASADYEVFNNTPDERYPLHGISPTAGTVEILFASDYVLNGSRHLLGYTHHRNTWDGVVVVYQPGEYQPQALDDLAGNNFQILANAIIYAGVLFECPADFNNDAQVDINDLVQVILGWGPCDAVCPEDLDADGVVDIDDLVQVVVGWGACS